MNKDALDYVTVEPGDMTWCSDAYDNARLVISRSDAGLPCATAIYTRFFMQIMNHPAAHHADLIARSEQ